MMAIRLSFFIVALALLAMPAPSAMAQGRDVGDQPGYIANSQDEQLTNSIFLIGFLTDLCVFLTPSGHRTHRNIPQVEMNRCSQK